MDVRWLDGRILLHSPVVALSVVRLAPPRARPTGSAGAKSAVVGVSIPRHGGVTKAADGCQAGRATRGTGGGRTLGGVGREHHFRREGEQLARWRGCQRLIDAFRELLDLSRSGVRVVRLVDGEGGGTEW